MPNPLYKFLLSNDFLRQVENTAKAVGSEDSPYDCAVVVLVQAYRDAIQYIADNKPCPQCPVSRSKNSE